VTPARRTALALAGLGLIAAATYGLSRAQDSGVAEQRTDRPKLLLLTSLPLIFPEDFGLDHAGSPALDALETRYRPVPISVTSASDLDKGTLLLMAHPPAQTPEDLVALDQWVRDGGKVLLLADPALEWPSERPLGDPLRPAPMFTDTGLLSHWGLRLDAPGVRGASERTLGGEIIQSLSPGRLSGGCALSGDGFVARCKLGEGTATVVADADFLDVDRLGARGRDNLAGLLTELGELESR